MSGRHRKPTTTGRTVAKVAVTGAIMGVAGIAATGTANAAPDSDWDRLAQCEAGGNWAINTGNGYQADCSSPPARGTHTAADSTQPPQTRPLASSRSLLPSVFSQTRLGRMAVLLLQPRLSSGATERSAPATTAPQAAPAPAQQVAQTVAHPVADAIDQAIAFAEANGIPVDPQILAVADTAKSFLK